MGKKSKSSGSLELPDRSFAHLRHLGFETTEEYHVWCGQNGFGLGLNKPKKMFARELQHRRATVHAIFENRIRSQKHSPREYLIGLAAGTYHPSDLPNRAYSQFAGLLHSYCSGGGLSRSHRSSLVRLIQHLFDCRSKIVDEASDTIGLVDGGISLITSLVLIAAACEAWHRPLAAWKPRTHNPRRQMQSLLRHLFDRFNENPRFMDHAWTIGVDASGNRIAAGSEYRKWYLEIGRGRGLRTLDLPIQLTRSMARYFKLAPVEATIPQALRWSQTMGLGGRESLAHAVMASRLGDGFSHEEFWATVIQWFAAQTMLDPVHVGPIVDYLHHQRFMPASPFENPLRAERGIPAEPNLTMKGRTAHSLLRHVEAWHRSVAGDNRHQQATWNASTIRGFDFREGTLAGHNLKVWTIRELLSSQSLAIEGRKLGHCVATYASSCARGSTSIWTLEVETHSGIEKRVTIEVRPAVRQIVQVRGRFNRKMTDQERSIIQRWCTIAGLGIGKYV